MNKAHSTLIKLTILCMVVGLAACSKGPNNAKPSRGSEKTGYKYNDKKNGGFSVAKAKEQKTGPGLVLIEGGTFVMGANEQGITYEHDNFPRRVTVSSFYMDETEVANVHWREYVYWLTLHYPENPEVSRKALPDTNVWRRELAFNEPYVQNYYRHPAYNYYPVVGVSWEQANEYCRWRTDRVNEEILAKSHFIERTPDATGQSSFSTDAYLNNKDATTMKRGLKDYSPNASGPRKVRFEDGIIQPEYRLPTEAEWEYAALSLVGNTKKENIGDKRIYPWNGHTMRYGQPTKHQGDMLANYKRGRGDLMGIAGNLNDKAAPTAPVVSYYPNDFGLFNMGGNVNEWVLDLYRPLSFTDVEDFNSFRGNTFTRLETNEDGSVADANEFGKIPRIADTTDRHMHYKSDVSDYLDTIELYDSSATLINNESRVYKGGGWRDMPYWLTPGSRRYLNQKDSRDDIGFRCAMIRVGSPAGKKSKTR